MNCKDVEWSSHGMIEVQSRHLPRKEKKTTKKPQSRFPMSWLRFKLITSQIQKYIIITNPIFLVSILLLCKYFTLRIWTTLKTQQIWILHKWNWTGCHSSKRRSCFLFGRSSVWISAGIWAILTEVFMISSVPSGKWCDSTLLRSLLLPSKSFPNYQSSIIHPF